MNSIVIEIPAEFKEIAEAVVSLIENLKEGRRRAQTSGRAVDYAKWEETIGRGAMAVERAAHATLLSALDIDAPEVKIGGIEHHRVLRGPGDYHTMAGTVSVERSLYRPVGQRNAPTVDPISLRAGVVGDGWLPKTAICMAHAVQMTTSRDAETQAGQQLRLPYSRSAFEDVTHEVGAHYLAGATEVEQILIERYQVPAATHSVSVSIDRVSIPMEEPRPRPAGRPRKGAPKRPIQRVYRMAYCGTLTLHDGRGEALHTIRYGRMNEGDVDGMMSRVAEDVRAIRWMQPEIEVVTLADGAPELWDRLDRAINPRTVGVAKVHRLLDFWHVVEKLAPAAQVIASRQADTLLARWKLLLLNRRDPADAIIEELVSSGCQFKRVGGKCPVDEAFTYLANHGDRMDYRSARRNGLPIGSGNVEATCKSLVAIRMKRAGARWKQTTGEHIIQLRALALSDRWDTAMRHTLRPLRRSVQILAA